MAAPSASPENEYERQRAARIRRNKEMLAQLGLDRQPFPPRQQPPPQRCPPAKRAAPAEPTRRSQRRAMRARADDPAAASAAETPPLAVRLCGVHHEASAELLSAAAAAEDPSLFRHNLDRCRSMSDKALRARAWKITNVLVALGKVELAEEAREAMAVLLAGGGRRGSGAGSAARRRAAAEAEELHRHNLDRCRSMSEKALHTRVWRITNVEKLHCFVHCVLVIFTGSQPQSAATKYFPLFATLGTGDMSRVAAERGCLVYCGNLPEDIRAREIEDYGRIVSVDLKTPARPPAFAFIEFADPRDAEDAVRGRDGYDFYGQRLRVEIARGARDRAGGGGGFGDRGGFGGGGGFGDRPRGPPGVDVRPRGTGFRVTVKGLPLSASWQDLKDFFRQVITPSYTNVFRDHDGVIGIVEFENSDDMDRAIRKLDDTEFRNPFDRTYVRIYEDRGGYGAPFPSQPYDPSTYRRGFATGGDRDRGRSRSPPRRSRSHSRSRSRSRSPARGRSASPSRSRSPARGRSASRSRSRSPARGRSASRSRSPARGRSASRSRSPRRSASRSRSRSPARSRSKSPAREASPPPQQD
eukprot:scaffold29.g5941.t1